MNEKINENRVKISRVYALKDGSTMKKEVIEKKKKRFKRLYVDTFKHEQDVRKWIESGTRKKGDIRRSLKRLENKYQELLDLNDEFNQKGIFQIKQLEDVNKNVSNSVIQLNNKIKELYNLAGIEKEQINKNNVKNMNSEEIDLVTDIPGNLEMLGLVKENKNTMDKKEKTKYFDFRKLGKRVATFTMAMIMTIFAGVKANDSKGHVYEKETNSYTDTNGENENTKEKFKETLYVEVAETIKQEAETINQEEEVKPTEQLEQKQTKIETTKINVSTNEKDKKSTVEESEYYLVKSGSKYTESSDGSGNIGYFPKDIEAKVYNRALVKTDKDGNKRILEATKIGQTWREYAEEKGLKYDEFKAYIDNNENIQECISLQSVDGSKLYGWIEVNDDALEKIEEMER